MFIKHILLSLLILCITTLAYGKDTKADNAHYTNDGSNTTIITNALADIDNLSGLSPLDVIKNPNLLDDKWDLKPIPLSAYTEEEKQLQQLINDKTATAVKTYSTPEQSKEWTKYDHEEITPYTWKIVELALTEANGKTFNVTLLRPNWWILNIGADRKGNRFYLKIPEVAEGSALVTNIRTNQLDTRLWNEQRNGDYVYRPITATFEHESSQVLNLYFANNKEPIGVTAEHPFYSLDRQDFVRADNLSIGEKVKTHQGQTALLDKTKLEGTHKVYNIEVYKDHNYMVSMDSLLVHNKGVGGNYSRSLSNDNLEQYNTTVLRGGNGQAIAGHGTHNFQSGTFMYIPEGTSIIALPRGRTLTDRSGRFLETTNLEKLARLSPNERVSMVTAWAKKNGIKDQAILERIKKDVRSLEVYTSNDKIPDYIIHPPKDLTIYQRSTSVDKSTQLSELIKPNQGCIGLATCTEIDYTK